MGRLGFDRLSGLIYEGREGPTQPVWPTPALVQATLVSAPFNASDIPGSFESSSHGWMYVDSSFDPTSRIRRGRLFQKFGAASWEPVQVEAHPAMSSDLGKRSNHGGRVTKELSVYLECTELLQMPNQGQGLQLALGQRDGYSLWRILQTERLATRDVMLTMRAESAFGIIPALDKSKLPPDSLKAVEAALDRVVNSAYKELPQSVVDHCRNAAVIVISRFMQSVEGLDAPVERDLGFWISEVRRVFGDKDMVPLRSTLEVINRLHPRVKDNEVHKLGLRPPTESDAEYVVHAIGFLLREVKWAL